MVGILNSARYAGTLTKQERPIAKRTIPSTYLSTIQSIIAPKSLFLFVRRATEPSVKSRMPDIARRMLPIMKWVVR